jgi:hypothetical protein
MNKSKPSRQNVKIDLDGPESMRPARLGPDIKARIGQELIRTYAEIVNQGVPDRFADILRGLDVAPDEGAPDNSIADKGTNGGAKHESS